MPGWAEKDIIAVVSACMRQDGIPALVINEVAVTKEEAEIVRKALKEANDEIIASPQAMNERFRIAFMHRAREQGIE